jgi:hypothetical protein
MPCLRPLLSSLFSAIALCAETDYNAWLRHAPAGADGSGGGNIVRGPAEQCGAGLNHAGLTELDYVEILAET